MANSQDHLEVVIHVEYNDPQKEAFYLLEDDFPKICILTGYPIGYLGLGVYFDRLFRLSTGSLLLAICDDVQVKTRGWDEAYRKALRNIPYSVAGAHVTEGPMNPCNWSWAFPMVRREVCEALGSWIPGGIAYDRVIAGYGSISSLGVIADVKLETVWSLPERGSQRDIWYQYCRGNWDFLQKKWEEEANRVFRAVTGHRIEESLK